MEDKKKWKDKTLQEQNKITKKWVRRGILFVAVFAIVLICVVIIPTHQPNV